MTEKIKATRRFARKSKTEGQADLAARSKDSPPSSVPGPTSGEKRPSKSGVVVALLQRSEGATLAELVEATGWLSHTARAALTGLKKKGKVITKGKRRDVTCYFIASSPA